MGKSPQKIFSASLKLVSCFLPSGVDRTIVRGCIGLAGSLSNAIRSPNSLGQPFDKSQLAAFQSAQRPNARQPLAMFAVPSAILWPFCRTNRRFEFQKRGQLFIRSHNETLSIGLRDNHEDGSPLCVHAYETAQIPTCFLEIVTDVFPILQARPLFAFRMPQAM